MEWADERAVGVIGLGMQATIGDSFGRYLDAGAGSACLCARQATVTDPEGSRSIAFCSRTVLKGVEEH
jgi:hypothetical protein